MHGHVIIADIYIYKAIRLSVRPSVTPITHLGQPSVTYQLPNVINPSSSYFKFVTVSECSDQIAFCSRLKTKKRRKLEQHSIENHSHMAQSVVQLTCIQEVAGSNPCGEQLFFFWLSILFQTRFFRNQFWQLCYFAFQACIEAGLERNWTHVIWELEYVDC